MTTGLNHREEEGILEVKTRGPMQTQRLGQLFGEMLSEGAVVAMMGDLGSGKTVLAKGIARGLGVEDERDVTSPSFVLVNEYLGRIPVYHVDLYRLKDSDEMDNLGWEEFINGPGVTLVEWAEKFKHLLPEERFEVYLQWTSSQERRIVLSGKGRSARDIVNRLGEKWKKEE